MEETKGQKGFSLLEVIIASGVIVIMIMAAVFAGTQAIRMAVIAKHKTMASNLARKKMEEIRAGRDKITVLSKKWQERDSLWPKQARTCELKTDLGKDFNVCAEIAEMDNLDDSEYNPDFEDVIVEKEIGRKVVVEVEWSDYGKRFSTIAETYLTNWAL